MVDPLDTEHIGECTMGEGKKTQKELDEIADKLRNLDATFLRMTSEKATKQFSNGYFDFIFIDGDHSYESVKQDIEMWLPKLKEDGVLAGDDYKGGRFSKYVQRALKETLGEVNHIEKVWYVHNPSK